MLPLFKKKKKKYTSDQYSNNTQRKEREKKPNPKRVWLWLTSINNLRMSLTASENMNNCDVAAKKKNSDTSAINNLL